MSSRRHDKLVKEEKMREDKISERRMHLATRLENMGYQLHGPHKGWLITRISSVDSLPTLDHVETLVEQLEKRKGNDIGTGRDKEGEMVEGMMAEHRYFLALDESLAQTLGFKSEWHEVTKEQFIQGERLAGFSPKSIKADSEKELATAGFSGKGIRGRIKSKEK